MTKKIVISEKDNIGAVIEDNKVSEFFVSKGDVLLGDVYLSVVDNILPSIDAAFVDVGMPDKMGFIHTDDIVGKGTLKEKVKPKQKLIVQVVKEPTGHKGPRVTTALSLPGRFLVLLPDEKGVNVSRKIVSSKERARLKSIVSLLKPVGVGVIVRTEAEGQSEAEIQEDLEILLEKWNSIVNAADTANPPCLLHRDQELLYKVIREACTEDVDEIVVDTAFALHRTTQLLQHWNMKVKVSMHKGTEPLLAATGINKEIQNALQTKVNLPLGGYLFIQQTEALTVVDVNSGKFTSSSSQAETILKTNLEAADEIARQLKLRNIGGMVIIDFIDMISRVDKLKVLEYFELALEKDKAKPQIGQLSDLGLVELTRHRQGQSLSEIFTKKCDKCGGQGFVIEDLKLLNSNAQGEIRAKINKIKGPFGGGSFNNQNNNQGTNQNNQQGQNRNNFKNKKRFNRNDDRQNSFENKESQIQNAEMENAQKSLNRDVSINETVKNEPVKQENVKNVQNNTEDLVNNIVDTIFEDSKLEKEPAAVEAKTEEKPKKVSRKTKKTMKKLEAEANNEAKIAFPAESAPIAEAQTDDGTAEEKPKKRGRKPSAKTAADGTSKRTARTKTAAKEAKE
jgi:ribonuclease E